MPDNYGTPTAEDIQVDPETMARNEAKFFNSNHEDVCFCCGRGLTAKAIRNGWMIRLVTDGTLATENEVLDQREDQGYFPVGSECAKRVPAAYRIKADLD